MAVEMRDDAGDRAGTDQARRSRMDQVIGGLASALGGSIGWMAEHGVLLAIFALIWVAFGAGLVMSQGSIDQAWQTIRALPLIAQLLVWLLFLPAMVGLWVWETTWPFVVRIVLVIGIAGWNLLVLLPRAAQAPPA